MSDQPTIIQMADWNDEPEIWKLCEEMQAEQPKHNLNWDRVGAVVRLATRRERGILLVVRGEGSYIKAACLLVLDQVWYSDDWQLVEYFNFVRKNCRKSTYAKDLIAYAKGCADTLGVELIVFAARAWQRHAPPIE